MLELLRLIIARHVKAGHVFLWFAWMLSASLVSCGVLFTFSNLLWPALILITAFLLGLIMQAVGIAGQLSELYSSKELSIVEYLAQLRAEKAKRGGDE